MPPATEHTGNGYRPMDEALRAAAADELRQRREAHTLAWRYYEGRHRRHFAFRPGEPDDHVTINLLRQAVDRTVAFLVPDFPGLELDERAETGAERWLRAAWDAAGGARALQKMARFGCLDGHVFVRVVPDAPFPRLVILNPANVIAFWQADDHERVLWYEVHWSAGGADFRQDIVRESMGDPAGGWLIRDWRREGESWVLTGEAGWPYALGPVIDWQHDLAPDRFYGAGEALNLSLNDRVNRIASDMSRILRFHAAPRTVGIGFEAEDVTATAIDTLWTINTPDAKVYNLEMSGDLSSSMGFLEFCARAFMAERRVVMLRGEAEDMRHLTNLGIRALFMDSIGRAAELRRGYAEGIIGLSRRLLMLNGMPHTGRISLNWPDALPVDSAEAVGVLARERALGIISRETAARSRGYDWLLERDRLRIEGETGLRDDGEGER